MKSNKLKKISQILCIGVILTTVSECSVQASPSTGWVKKNNDWYYYNGGHKSTGWIKSDGLWYYLSPNSGQMQTGWIQDNGAWYYLNNSGVMVTNVYIGQFYIGPNGKWIQDGGDSGSGKDNKKDKEITLEEAQKIMYKEDKDYLAWMINKGYTVIAGSKGKNETLIENYGINETVYSFYIENSEYVESVIFVGAKSKKVYRTSGNVGNSVYVISNNKKVQEYKYYS
ncbi:hypothetical protein [Clostridium neonatale]|uniref:hypothetical protein n=1 Tax=Clostridium neonatale TaxID=137838 RepID=UPI00291BA0D2|nr:Conserved hypothetical protein, Cell wall/choline-binding repeat domain [Clostridium neonatale]